MNKHTYKPQIINFWTAILGGPIVGPIFFTKTLTTDADLNMLKNIIDPLITEEVQNLTTVQRT